MHRSGILTVAFSLFAFARGSILRRDIIESNATCEANFEWTFNKEGLSPCLLLAAVSAPCLQGVFITAGPLLPGEHYDPPAAENSPKNPANLCSCSWAAYNLMSACTVCQGQTSSVAPWPSYRANCGKFISNTTYWPSDISIAGNHTLPFYAGHDPNTWTDQQFNTQQALQITNQSHPDLTGHDGPIPNAGPAGQKKSKPIGAIVGGTIGGVFVVGLALLLLFCMCRRRRASLGVQEIPPRRPSYFSNSSGDSADSRKRMMSVASISSLGSVASSQPYSPNTMYTYDGTMQSFSQFGSASMYTTQPQTSPSHQHHARVVSPAPTMQTIAPGPPDHINPFMLMSPDESPDTLAHRRKEAIGRGVTPTTHVQFVSTTALADAQTTPEHARQLRGVMEEEDDHQPRTVQNRGRSQSQPPAYDTLLPTPSETGSTYDHAALLRERQGHSHQAHGAPPGKGSQDSQTSQWTAIGGVSESMANPTTNTSVPAQATEDDDAQTPRAEPARITRYRSVQSSESRDTGDAEVA